MCIEKKKSKEEKRNDEKNMFYGTSIKARLVCHTTAKFIYLIQTNGSFRKLVKYPPPPALCCFCKRFWQKPSFQFCALHVSCYATMLSCLMILSPMYLLSHTFSYGLNPFADFAFIWHIHEHVR